MKQRVGFNAKEKKKMLLSDETRLGIKLLVSIREQRFIVQKLVSLFSFFPSGLYIYIVRSFIELTEFVFTIPGMKVFLSEKVSQDALEKFFGCQLTAEATKDNRSQKRKI